MMVFDAVGNDDYFEDWIGQLALDRRRTLGAVALLLPLLAACASAPSSTVSDESGYQIVSVEHLKKGGSFNPPAPPVYVLLRAEATLTGTEPPSEARVKWALAAIISELRRQHAPDAVTVFLYQSPKHVAGSLPLGRGEWWPHGHSLARSNARNVANKQSYVLDLKVDRLPKPSEATGPSRISASKRREIFAANVHAEDRAEAEAQDAYPTDGTRMSIAQMRTFDFATSIRKNQELYAQLFTKYKRELINRYRISEDELLAIRRQAHAENWPLPEYPAARSQ